MTRPHDDIVRVQELIEGGCSASETARLTGVPRKTITDWIGEGLEELAQKRLQVAASCDPCPHVIALPEEPYVYLLGLYLGDGCISAYPRGVYRLRVTLDKRSSWSRGKLCSQLTCTLDYFCVG